MQIFFIDAHGEHYSDTKEYLDEGHSIIYCNVEQDHLGLKYLGKSKLNLQLSCSFKSKRRKIELFLEIEKYLAGYAEIEKSLMFFSRGGCMVALYLQERWGVPYTIMDSDKIEKLGHDDWPFIFNAEQLLSNDTASTARFESENYLPIQHLKDLNVATTQGETQPENVAFHSNNASSRKNVLLVSYFFPPFSGVGSARAAYWKTNIPKLSNFDVDVVTAINHFNDRDSIIFVPDYREHSIFCRRASELTHLKDNLINPLGLTWVDSLEKYFNDTDKNYSYVIFTGNPFFHFEFASFCKNKWGSKIILDYRDPFANNPFMLYSDDTHEVISKYEMEYSRLADLIVSVNTQCIELLELHDSNAKVIDINNGYDETLVDDFKHRNAQVDGVSFVYAGSLSFRFNPIPFAASLGEMHHFDLAGRITGHNDLLTKYKQVKNHGLLSYLDTLALLNRCQAGIIFDPGEVFMSTTKIFDYIATDLDIIILYDHEPYHGSLHDITQNLSGVYWVKNNEEDVLLFLQQYQPSETSRANKHRYSRKYQTTRLIQCINTL